MGNEKPSFADKELTIKKVYQIGKDKQYRKLLLATKHGKNMDALYFGDADEFDAEYERAKEEKKKFSCIYYPSVNEYKDKRTIQIVIKEYRF